ncbi:hypothetical protein GcC1_148029 [Golovinomyces cichoracearum]|uniref:Uncharacterized protein n=1 Tax=Golovinomyces cichoracearum TaxID=62708 RepID=A0A420HXY4_9PEZI|nr:hypothetical protein GcC1_148029 [Golovinomyces cichoracearum]
MSSRAARYREFVRQLPHCRDSDRLGPSDWNNLSDVCNEAWHRSRFSESVRRATEFLTGLEAFVSSNPECDLIVFSNRLGVLDSLLSNHFSNDGDNADYDRVMLEVVAVDTTRGAIVPLTARKISFAIRGFLRR